MDREGILWVIGQIGARNILPQGSNVQISCPLAQWRKGHKSIADGKPSMGILVDENEESLVHCFACKFGGTLQDLIEELHMRGDVSYKKLIEKVAAMEAVDPEWLADSIEDWEAPRNKYEVKVIDEAEISHMLGKTHRRMLERGLEIATLKAWKSGFDEEQKRAVFPVYQRSGELVGMVGRAVSKFTMPKYINYFDFDKGRFLYGEHMVREGTTVVVCEGLIDALATWQALSHADMLKTYSVTSFLGAQATKNQLKRLVNITDDVVLFLDNDPAGWTGQMLAARYLSDKVRVKAVKYPEHIGGDPAQLAADGIDVVSLITEADLLVA